MRTSDNEFPRWVYKILYVTVEQLLYFGITLGNDTRHKNVNHIVLNLVQHLLVVHVKIVMLSTYHYCVNAQRFFVLGVFYCYLTFCIGA